MSIWFVIPSKRPIAEANRCFDAWRRQGYRTAAFIDAGDPKPDVDLLLSGQYQGYARAVNQLSRLALTADAECSAVVTGGDDVFPDSSHTADELESEFLWKFPDTLGIMQPVGDGFDANDCCCVSPWLGREYVRRGYGGRGPLSEAYPHFAVDKELFDVAGTLSLLWLRPDLSQYHEHWTRTTGQPPEFMRQWRSRIEADVVTYQQRKAEGFPGHELLPR